MRRHQRYFVWSSDLPELTILAEMSIRLLATVCTIALYSALALCRNSMYEKHTEEEVLRVIQMVSDPGHINWHLWVRDVMRWSKELIRSWLLMTVNEWSAIASQIDRLRMNPFSSHGISAAIASSMIQRWTRITHSITLPSAPLSALALEFSWSQGWMCHNGHIVLLPWGALQYYDEQVQEYCEPSLNHTSVILTRLP